MTVKETINAIEHKFFAYLFKNKKYIAMSIADVKPDYLMTYVSVYRLLLDYYSHYQEIPTKTTIDMLHESYKVDNDTYNIYCSLLDILKTITISDNEVEFKTIKDELFSFYKRRKYYGLAQTIIEVNPFAINDERFNKLEQSVNSTLLDINSETSDIRAEGSLQSSMRDMVRAYKELEENPNAIHYIKSGFDAIDNEGGFRPSELIYVIGRKGDGKSTLILNFAHNMWKDGHNIILFSLEMSKEDYLRRFIARAADISSKHLKLGTLEEYERARFRKIAMNLTTANVDMAGNHVGVLYIIDVPGICTPAFIDSYIETTEQKLGIKFEVCISDYAGIMAPNIMVPEKRHQQGSIALDLKRIARKRNILVMSAAQMTRAGRNETKDKAEGNLTGSEHIAESDQIADHIDWGIAIRSLDKEHGIIESFKTRDAAQFNFKFKKEYEHMMIRPYIDEDLAPWTEEV